MALTHAETRLRADLSEDRLTAWVPDALGSFDLDEAAAAGLQDPAPAALPVTVPRADGRREVRHVLSPSVVAALHSVCAEFRDLVDAALAPGVCGYRSGADASSRYVDEYLRFQEFTSGEAENAGHVVYADVRSFFGSMRLENLVERLAYVAGSASAALTPVVEALQAAGLETLPAGYADTRLLANACLARVDADLSVPFARWVDDYRLFVPRGEDPAAALATLARSLGGVGLELNAGKTRVVAACESEAISRNALSSVYHPDRGDPARDRASLRSVFYAAAGEPVEQRRSLRFTLRRLAAEGDDAAVPFALSVLNDLPWEAPRLVSYLAVFVSRDDVIAGVGDLACSALDADDEWVVARLAPLIARMPADAGVVASLAQFVRRSSRNGAAWGLALRCLSLAGAADEVRGALAGRIPDPRAAVAACADLGLPTGPIAALAPSAVAACHAGPPPMPDSESIL
jgi:hypothetical protein